VGTCGYRYASDMSYLPDEVIFEVGSGESTRYLAAIGPLVVTIDVDLDTYDEVSTLSNVEAHYGRVERLLRHWSRPIGFAWLDGHDWPYTGATAGYFDDQQLEYERRGQEYSQDASRRAHLTVAQLIASHAHVIAFDDTWRTHSYISGHTHCAELVPPATMPAYTPALNQIAWTGVCALPIDHPHHDDPERGWNGKGGTAVPYLLSHGFDVVEYGLGLVVLTRTEVA
jgi:hypothetical protein